MMPMNSDFLDINFCKAPFTFVPVDGYTQIWNASERTRIGVYLWCIPVDGILLIKYVGTTWDRRGFEGRLSTELKDWRRGRYCVPVDLEEFKRGRRIELANPPAGHLEIELRELQPLYRIVLAPLASDRECRHVEASILRMLSDNRLTSQYLSNTKRGRPALVPRLRFCSELPLVGLTVSVPEWMTSFAERAPDVRCVPS